jgi:hypothetical protein
MTLFDRGDSCCREISTIRCIARCATTGIAQCLNVEAVNDWSGKGLPDGVEAGMSVESRKLTSTSRWSQGPLRVYYGRSRPRGRHPT